MIATEEGAEAEAEAGAVVGAGGGLRCTDCTKKGVAGTDAGEGAADEDVTEPMDRRARTVCCSGEG